MRESKKVSDHGDDLGEALNDVSESSDSDEDDDDDDEDGGDVDDEAKDEDSKKHDVDQVWTINIFQSSKPKLSCYHEKISSRVFPGFGQAQLD